MSAQHTPGKICDYPAADDFACQLHWAELHEKDLTIAEHNRKWFSEEVARLRCAIAKVTGEKT